MQRKRYSIEAGQPKNLVVQQHKGITDVFLENVQIGSISSIQDLREGRDLSLPDGSVMQIQLATGSVNADRYQLTRNGIAVPGSANDPKQRVSLAAKVCFFIAFIYTVVPILLTIATTPGNKTPEFPLIYFLFAGAMGLFGILVWRKIAIALYLAIALQVLETAAYFFGWIVSFVSIFSSSNIANASSGFSMALPSGLIIAGSFRVILLLCMIKAIDAIKEVKQISPQTSVGAL